MDGCIQFALITDVTKFGKVSDMNNLEDITMRKQYVSICGMTEQEIHENFEEHLRELSEAQGMTYKETCDKLRTSYGGYHFAPNSEDIYNPFSLLNTFYKMKYANYWFEYGTPTYLVELLKINHYNLEWMAHEEISSDVLNNIYSDEEPLPIIVQSGYLTIKSYDKEFGLYRLGFPNREVGEGFGKNLIPFCARYSK